MASKDARGDFFYASQVEEDVGRLRRMLGVQQLRLACRHTVEELCIVVSMP